MDEAILLTQQLVQIDSSDPGAYESEISDFIFQWLKEHAPQAQIEQEEALPGRKNVRAVLKGKKETSALVFICHMDTVMLGEGWTMSTPLEGKILDDRLYGRGSCDMKSGLACAMVTFSDLAKAVANGKELKQDCVFIASVDEEDYMRGGEKAIASSWVKKDDLIMDCEPTNGQIRVAHKGRTWIDLTVHGITAHASTPEQGVDAIAALAEMISRIRKHIETLPVHEKLGKSTVTFGLIKGGYRPYVVPDYAKVWVDMRLVPPANTDEVIEMFKAVIAEVKEEFKGITVDMELDGNRPPIEEKKDNQLLAYLKESVEHVTKEQPVVGVFTGYSDTAVIAGQTGNINTLSYGPGNLELAHKPNEYVELKDITRCHEVLVDLTHRVL